jgi:hypothetical protein
MRSRFLALRVRPAHGDEQRQQPRPVEWLLVEWPDGQEKPTKYCLATVPEDVELSEIVALAKIRWRIERDYTDDEREPQGPLTKAMRARLRRGGWLSRYRIRKKTVEPVFGRIKEARGFRRFLQRGLAKVAAERALLCTAHDLLELAGARLGS